MNGKFEGRLVKLAFGEVSAKESAALEKQIEADPEAKRTFAEYAQVKDGLHLLTDIPADQLSKERLRDAILGQGLKPLPVETHSRWGWTWMPATAFALVFGFLSLRHMNEPSAKVIGPVDGAVALNSKEPSVLKAPGLEPVNQKGVAVKPTASQKNSVPQPKHRAVKEVQFDASGFLTSVGAKRSGQHSPPAGILASNPIPNESRNAGGVVVANATHADSVSKITNAATPIVLINPEEDKDSRAQKAHEVDSAVNVDVRG